MNKYILKSKKLFYETNSSFLYRYKDKIIKGVKKSNISYKNEYNILSVIQNYKNIIHIEDSFSDKDMFYMMMNYYPRGDLQTHIRNKNVVITNYKDFVRKLINPLCVVHSHNIVHLDIKPSNYLLNYYNNDYTLIDFNLSKKVKSNSSYYELYHTDVCGTSGYISPEVYRGQYC